jgi:hypothetical protein
MHESREQSNDLDLFVEETQLSRGRGSAGWDLAGRCMSGRSRASNGSMLQSTESASERSYCGFRAYLGRTPLSQVG